MKKRSTGMQHWDRFIGWCMMLSAALFVGNFALGLISKL